MQLVEISAIEVGERQRKYFNRDALEELKESILQHGLLHPIVIKPLESGFRLVAGERRLRVIKELDRPYLFDGEEIPPGQIPALILEKDQDEIKLREIELTENIARQELTWQERTQALAELHKLRLEQGESHSILDTAKEIAEKSGRSVESERKRLKRATLIAEFLDDEEVLKAKNEAQAFGIVAKKLTEEFAAAAPKKKEQRHKLWHGRAEDILPQLPEKAFACIVTDPPYGLGLHKNQGGASNIHFYEDEGIDCYKILASHAARLLQDDAHLYAFLDIRYFREIKQIFEEEGFKVRQWPLIWYKGVYGHNPEGRGYSWRRSYEAILVAERGRRPYAASIMDTIVDIQQGRKLEHAAQKPVELYKKLLQQSCTPGDLVLDPFCGSGPIFDAASDLMLTAYGIDADKGAIALCRTLRGIDARE